MMLELQNRLYEFTRMHDDFISDWNHAMSSGDTSSVDRMSEDYYVAFFTRGNEKPAFFTKQEALNGMEQSVKHFIGSKKRFENRVIRLRDNENAVVFYELLIVKDENILARLFTIENWKFINGKWMIIRETEEPIS
ncbi:hypothetical protein [Evansella cellulosilytica]|uniref:DUF4440 domain-containing protein n=1 Tax=Evansella cellulosilytica (strain ATCC 21833 / DSM 2522 / FERM P-1141 / JCM 9156 / N-4) TaxID=649639 RepID=E6TVP8_EVAC2|nr:hypothetical protein [Evansella cellulosilytica]ADU32176.1 hypothetical protein Bcell_3942 [Evansella cellulosilytica DSM 2522]